MITKEQIQEWKNQYKDIFVISVADKKGILAYPPTVKPLAMPRPWLPRIR